jgi:hypothetical protein
VNVSGATKGVLSGSGTTRSLTISAISVANGANVTVSLSDPAGYSISPSSRSVAVYLAPSTNEGSVSNPVALTTNANHSFKAGGYDTSYYRFSTTGAGTYCLDLKAANYVTTLYSDSNFSATVDIDRSPAAWGAIFEGLSASTTYYLKIQNMGGAALSATGRVVDPAAIAAAAEADGFSSPVALSLGSAFSGKVGNHSYSSASDYSFTTAAAGDYKVCFSAPSPDPTNSLTFAVYSDSIFHSLIADGWVYATAGGSANLSGLSAGATYYVRLRNNTSNTALAYNVMAASQAPLPLSVGDSWTAGTMDASGTVWYESTVSAGQAYTLYLDTSFNGSGTMTCDAKVSAYQADKTTAYFTNASVIYTTGRALTVADGQTRIYFLVQPFYPFSPSSTGSFAIRLTSP